MSSPFAHDTNILLDQIRYAVSAWHSAGASKALEHLGQQGVQMAQLISAQRLIAAFEGLDIALSAGLVLPDAWAASRPRGSSAPPPRSARQGFIVSEVDLATLDCPRRLGHRFVTDKLDQGMSEFKIVELVGASSARVVKVQELQRPAPSESSPKR